jgi:hypothetical protein
VRVLSIISAGLLGVLGYWCAIALLLKPFQPFPFIDDWVYSWSVENLIQNGRLEVLDVSSNVITAQVLWGALFCLPFGFSFAALRVSTWVLAALALAGVYRLSREAGATPGGAAFGAATLAVFPPFVVLSFSFMTDVPMLTVEAWALVYFTRAYRNRSTRALWAGTLLTAVASAIRVVGLAPSLGLAAALLFDSRGWGRTRGRFLVPLAAWLAAGALALDHGRRVRHVADLSYIANTPGVRLEALRGYAVALLPTWLPHSLEFAAVGLGLALAPIALALVPAGGHRRRMVWLLAIAALVVAVGHMIGVQHYPAFASEGTWLSDELGFVLLLLPGWMPIMVPTAVTVAATMGSWASFLILGSSASRPREDDTANVPLWSLMAVLIGLTAVLWLTADRYILPFLAPAMALVLGRSARVSWRRGVVALSIFAMVGVVAVRDRLNAESAIWAAVNDLRQAGVPVSEIDAGYVVNGWLQYAHPEQAHRDASGNVNVPFVNGGAVVPWVVAVSPLPDTEVVREYPFGRIGRAPGRVFVLRRR